MTEEREEAILTYLDFHHDELIVFKNEVEVGHFEPFLNPDTEHS